MPSLKAQHPGTPTPKPDPHHRPPQNTRSHPRSHPRHNSSDTKAAGNAAAQTGPPAAPMNPATSPVLPEITGYAASQPDGLSKNRDKIGKTAAPKTTHSDKHHSPTGETGNTVENRLPQARRKRCTQSCPNRSISHHSPASPTPAPLKSTPGARATTTFAKTQPNDRRLD